MTATIDNSSAAGQALTDDITNVQISTPRGLQVITGLADSQEERLHLLGDASLTMNGVFNDQANFSHAVFKDIQTTSVLRTCVFVHSAQTLTLEMALSDYNLTRAADGSLTWSVPGMLGNGTSYGWS